MALRSVMSACEPAMRYGTLSGSRRQVPRPMIQRYEPSLWRSLYSMTKRDAALVKNWSLAESTRSLSSGWILPRHSSRSLGSSWSS